MNARVLVPALAYFSVSAGFCKNRDAPTADFPEDRLMSSITTASRRYFGFLAAVVVFLFGGAVMTPAQDEPLAPWVIVVPAANRTGNSALDPIGTTVADTIELTLRLLGEFEVQELTADRIPSGVVDGDVNALKEFSERETMDYVVFGSVEQIDEDFVITASVWERETALVTVSQQEVTNSIFGTFEASDRLATSFLSALSGQRIAFGSLVVQNRGWREGSYRVLVDGTQVGVDVTRIDSVLIGERNIAVVANTGARAGSIVFQERLQVTEGVEVSIDFALDPPGESVAEAPVVPNEPTQVGPDPESDTQPETEPASELPTESDTQSEAVVPEVPLRPWTRESRQRPERRPIVSLGIGIGAPMISLPRENNPLAIDQSVGSGRGNGVSLQLLLEYGRSRQIGIELSGSGTDSPDFSRTQESPEDFSVGYIRSDDIGELLFYNGYRVLQRHRGTVSTDLSIGIPLGLFGATLSYRQAESPTFADAGLLYATIGGRLMGRVSWRRLFIQARADILAYQGLFGPAAESDGFPAEKLPSNGLVFRSDLGAGISLGGRPRRER